MDISKKQTWHRQEAGAKLGYTECNGWRHGSWLGMEGPCGRVSEVRALGIERVRNGLWGTMASPT